MSRPKFAPITSSLLARKGDAKPWQPASTSFAEIVSQEHLTEGAAGGLDAAEAFESICAPVSGNVPQDNLATLKVAFPPPARSPGTDHPKRCTLALSPVEYECLGIIAVKKGFSRHQILRQAFEQYLNSVADDYRQECECLTGRACQRDC